MAHEHAVHHETSPAPIWVGLGALFATLSFTGFFQWKSPMLGLIFGGIAAILLIVGLALWADDFFTHGKDEGHGTTAIVFFVLSEVIIFGSMFAAFWRAWEFHYHEWPKYVAEMNFIIPIILTFILWASSFTILKAEHAIEEGDRSSYNKWLLATFILGFLFVVIHVNEWRELWHEGYTLSSNMSGTAFYVLTGFHTSHVLVGLVGQLYFLWVGIRGLIDEKKVTGVKALSFYWHFVDIVWLFVATNAYFINSIPRLTAE